MCKASMARFELDDLLRPDFRLNSEPVGLADFKEFVSWHASVLTEVRFAIEDLIVEQPTTMGRTVHPMTKALTTGAMICPWRITARLEPARPHS
jgi:hypothetical protein